MGCTCLSGVMRIPLPSGPNTSAGLSARNRLNGPCVYSNFCFQLNRVSVRCDAVSVRCTDGRDAKKLCVILLPARYALFFFFRFRFFKTFFFFFFIRAHRTLCIVVRSVTTDYNVKNRISVILFLTVHRNILFRSLTIFPEIEHFLCRETILLFLSLTVQATVRTSGVAKILILGEGLNIYSFESWT